MRRVAALLHDTIEDCFVDERDLIAEGASVAAASFVRDLTRGDGETYDAFIRRIKARGGAPLRIKLADIADNSDPARLATLRELDEDRATRLSTKYDRALRILNGD